MSGKEKNYTSLQIHLLPVISSSAQTTFAVGLLLALKGLKRRARSTLGTRSQRLATGVTLS